MNEMKEETECEVSQPVNRSKALKQTVWEWLIYTENHFSLSDWWNQVITGTAWLRLARLACLYLPVLCLQKKLIEFRLTSMHPLECCFGDKKKVPSTKGYLSNTSMGSSHNMQATRLLCWAAKEDRMNNLVSSFPWFPSSSICKEKNVRKIINKKNRINILYQYFILIKNSSFMSDNPISLSLYVRNTTKPTLQSSQSVCLIDILLCYWKISKKTPKLYLFI